jgi:CBS domain-containing protein
MRIGDIGTRDVIQCTRTTTALELARIMRSSHVGDVVVVDQPNGHKIPVGIVTDRDLAVEVMARERNPATVTAGELMGAELVTTAEENDIYEVVELMRFKGVRRVPVVDEQGGLSAIVTLDDLLNLIGGELTLLGRVISRERSREEQSRR